MITLTTKEQRNARKRELAAIRRESLALADVDRLPTTVIIWRGPSPIDGSPIAAIVTNLVRVSENPKTGDMPQTYILRTDIPPQESVQRGLDVAICGNCVLKPSNAKARRAAGELDVPECYVQPFKIRRLWNSIPNLPHYNAGVVGNYCAALRLSIRDGAYGDPAMVPVDIWDQLHRAGGKGTSYTHQWETAPREMANWAMASVQTVAEKNAANAIGYRTYRVTTGALESDEIICPESTVGISCADCGLCAGNRVQAKNIVIRPI